VPKYRIDMPDGSTYEVEHDQELSEDQVLAAISEQSQAPLPATPSATGPGYGERLMGRAGETLAAGRRALPGGEKGSGWDILKFLGDVASIPSIAGVQAVSPAIPEEGMTTISPGEIGAAGVPVQKTKAEVMQDLETAVSMAGAPLGVYGAIFKGARGLGRAAKAGAEAERVAKTSVGSLDELLGMAGAKVPGAVSEAEDALRFAKETGQGPTGTLDTARAFDANVAQGARLTKEAATLEKAGLPIPKQLQNAIIENQALIQKPTPIAGGSIGDMVTGTDRPWPGIYKGAIEEGRTIPKSYEKPNIYDLTDMTPEAVEAELRRLGHPPITGAAQDVPTFEARTRRITHEMVDAAADRLGLRPDQVLAGKAYNAEELIAIGKVFSTQTEDVLAKAAALVQQGGDSAAARGGLVDSISELLDSRFKVFAAHGETGRAHEIVKGIQRHKDLSTEIAKRLARLDPSHPNYMYEVQKFLTSLEKGAEGVKPGKQALSDWLDVVHGAWVNGRLSSLWTQVKNAVSNTAMLLLRPMTTVYRGGIDAAYAQAKGIPRSIYAGEAWHDLVGMVSALKGAAKEGWHTFRTGESMFPSTSKLEMYRGTLPKKLGVVGKILSAPGDVLVGADEFYKTLSYQGMTRALTFRELKQNRGVITGIDETRSRIHKLALAEADRTTFTNRLPHAFQSLSQARQIPGVRYIIPFFNTNMNVLLASMEHTPILGFLAKGLGYNPGLTFGDQIARQMAGLSAATGAAWMTSAMGGDITGGGPTDPTQRKTLMASGWKPYSIKFPGLPYMSMSELTGLFPILTMIGDMHDLGDSVDKGDAAFRIARSIMTKALEPQFASNVVDFFEAMEDPTGQVAQRWLQRQASTVVPAGLQAVTEFMDPTVRRPGKDAAMLGIPEAIGAKIPGLQTETPALRDIWGRPIQRSMGPLEVIFGPTQPETTRVDDEVARLVNNTGLAIGSVQDKLEGVQLSSDQYDKYVERSGELARIRVGQLIRSSRYSRFGDEAKAELIHEAFDESRDRAKSEIIRQDRQLRKDINEQARQEIRKWRTPKSPGKALETVRNR